jgi:excisionase family DNA binding protein
MKKALSIPEAAEALGLGRTSVYELINAGRLGSFTVGRRRFITERHLDDFIASRCEAA